MTPLEDIIARALVTAGLECSSTNVTAIKVTLEANADDVRTHMQGVVWGVSA